MRLALAQLDPVVGAVEANADDILRTYGEACAAGAQLVATPELTLTGYPPEDLVLKRSFVAATAAALERIAAATSQVPLVVGLVESVDEPPGAWGYPPLANAAAVCRAGLVEAVYRKERLPNYGVFDEARYFRPRSEPLVIAAGGAQVGITICEDMWGEEGPVQAAAAAGATVVVNINASPYHRGKREDRERWARRHSTRYGIWLGFVNEVGGQDEIVFDGDSFVMDPGGVVVARGAQFATDVVVVDLPVGDDASGVAQIAGDAHPRMDRCTEIYAALVLATRDYIRDNGFRRALIGLSGGIDSALVATIAADAIGAENVTGVAMPSPYSSAGSIVDAKALAAGLGIGWLELGIEGVMDAFAVALAEPFAGTESGLAEENIQARIRGSLLMALSNKRGDIVLATGNKSEYSVGYATLYGDMAGGFAVIKDVPKMLVYELARHRNVVAGSEVIPGAILTKAPSAELRPDQRDSDSLPPYEVLDPILEAYVERDASVPEIVADGFDEATVRKVATLVDRAEYKRRQAPPGVKITERAFGKDRRLPITQGWSEQTPLPHDPRA
ncbi:MAG: NAD+ synthase [Nitriliruptorales bacterium]|nr:NAD+ synthase [Nitriliruptorales bacterium]